MAEGRRLLRAAGFRVSKRRFFEANTLLDAAGGTLGRAGCLLRIREVGGVGLLTYKGPAAAGKYKDREELEVQVADPRRLAELVARLGFVKTLRYEKYRAEYGRPGESGVATLDEVPFGVYFELEGTPAWIDRSARRLGFPESAYIIESYFGLYAAYCREHGLPVGDMTFGGQQDASKGNRRDRGARMLGS